MAMPTGIGRRQASLRMLAQVNPSFRDYWMR